MYNIVYSLLLVIFFILWFKTLQAIKPERMFRAGKTFEIKFFYCGVSLILAYLMTEFVDKILSFWNFNM